MSFGHDRLNQRLRNQTLVIIFDTDHIDLSDQSARLLNHSRSVRLRQRTGILLIEAKKLLPMAMLGQTYQPRFRRGRTAIHGHYGGAVNIQFR